MYAHVLLRFIYFYPYLNEFKPYLMEVIFKCSNFMDNDKNKYERREKERVKEKMN